MNLIDNLRKSFKWSEFELWYEKWIDSHKKNYHTFNFIIFQDFSFDIQKGIFEKFIIDSDLIIGIDGYLDNHQYYIFRDNKIKKKFASFEQLVIWFFNNKT